MRSSSPKSRVEALKLEILNLNKRLSSSSKARPLYESLPLQVKIQSPVDGQKAELLAQLSLLRKKTEGKQFPLQSQISSLEAQISVLEASINRERASIDAQKRDIETRLQQQQEVLRGLQKQYEDLQQTQALLQAKLETEYQTIAADFDSKITPLEAGLENAGIDFKEAETSEIQCREERGILEERMAMCLEEIDGTTLQRAEFVAHREEMEELYDDLKRKYGKEISEFISGAEQKHAVGKLKDHKNGLIEKMKTVDKLLEANSASLKSTQDSYHSVQSSLQSLLSAAPNVKTQQDLEKLETLIKLKTPDFTQLLEEAVLDINAVNGFDIDEGILRQQMKEVETRLGKMEAETQREQARLLQEASDLNEELSRCEGKPDSSEKDTEYTRDLRRRLFSIKEAQQQQARQYQRRRAAVEQWRAEAGQLLSEAPTSSQVRAADELIIDDFKSRAHYPGSLDPLLSQYILKLRERERYLQANQGTVAGLQAQLTTIEAQGETAKQEKSRLLRDKAKLRQELTKVMMEEKRAAKRGEDIGEAVKSTQSLKVGKRIDDILGKVDYWEERIEACNRNLIDLSTGYRKGETRKDELQSTQEEMKSKSTSSKEKETALLTLIGDLLEQKKAALLQSLEKLNSALSSSADNSNEQSLLAEIKQTSPIVESLRNQLKQASYDRSAGLASLQQQLLDSQKQLVRIKNELAEVETDLEKAKGIETQLSELEEPCRGSMALYRSQKRHPQPSDIPEASLRSSRSASQQRMASKRGCRSSSPTRQGFVDSHNSVYSQLLSEADQSVDNIDLSIARGIQLANELPAVDSSLSVRGRMKKYFRLEDASAQEQVFFEKVRDMQVQHILEGTDLYKKFTQRQFLKQKPFDPLNGKETPPEACGYGIRNLRLSANLLQIEVRHPMKPGVDSSLLVEQILAPVIPQMTMTILRHQKRLLNSDSFVEETFPLPNETLEKQYSEMRESGFINVNSEAFQEKCKECNMYPFAIALQQGGRVEFIARTYSAFKAWVTGLNALVRYRKQLPRLRQKIETYTTVS